MDQNLNIINNKINRLFELELSQKNIQTRKKYHQENTSRLNDEINKLKIELNNLEPLQEIKNKIDQKIEEQKEKYKKRFVFTTILALPINILINFSTTGIYFMPLPSIIGIISISAILSFYNFFIASQEFRNEIKNRNLSDISVEIDKKRIKLDSKLYFYSLAKTKIEKSSKDIAEIDEEINLIKNAISEYEESHNISLEEVINDMLKPIENTVSKPYTLLFKKKENK